MALLTRTRVSLAVNDGVARIEIDGDSTRNALDRQSASEIAAACDAVDADESVGVAVITGANRTFCSGAARDSLSALRTVAADVAYEELGALYRAFDRVGSLKVPTIARIEGAAVGAGLNLALATDLRIAADDARFISGFAAHGVHPGGGHLHLIDRAAGRQAAAALGVFARPLSAAEAKSIGLVWDAVPAEALDDVIASTCATLRVDPHLARAVKASLNLTTSPSAAWAVAVEVERARQMWSLTRGPRTSGVAS